MKNIFTLLFLVVFLSDASGQSAGQKWTIGLFGGKTEYKGDLGSGIFDINPFYGHAGLSLNRCLNNSFDAGLQIEHGSYGFFKSTTANFLSHKTDGSLLFMYKLNNGYIIKEDAIVAPFLAAGIGFAGFTGKASRTKSGNLDAFIPLGGGFKMNITPDFAIQYLVFYNLTNGDTRDLDKGDRKNDKFLSHSVGLVFSFGAPKDSDGDGVPDKLDKCAATPGDVSVTISGCPVDTDTDGIADYLDKCPLVAGQAAFNGCPDSDGDGVEDSEDNCPDIKGLAALNGCPDADGDGITDAEDKCPEVKGLPEFSGCPDTDGDGITDSDDRCPNAKGTKELQGCPDRDGDGIADIDDKCPATFGTKENKGCPAVKEEAIKVFTRALTGILFEPGKDVIKVSSYPILNNVVTIMKDNPEYNLEIIGHTDSVGNDAKNLTLSQRRADAVKKYLANNGIEVARMTSKGYGETKPVADNNTASGRTINRRVELKVVF